MSKPLIKTMLLSLFPKGAIWSAKAGGFFDGLLNGIADSFETVKSTLSSLADIRNAKKTTVLDDLEKDMGVPFNPALTEAERRISLDARINSIDNTGSRQELETALQRAGFPLFVYSNSPAVDPRRFELQYVMTADDENSFAGDEFAYAGSSASDLVVNGDITLVIPEYAITADSEFAFADNADAFAGVVGEFESLFEYFVPENSDFWPFVFFVGGAATFSITGEIISIETVDIDDNRRAELRELILRYKPQKTWGILIVNYV